jgi:hypothetical protein
VVTPEELDGRVRVPRRIACDAVVRTLEIRPDGDAAAPREGVCPLIVRLDELEPVIEEMELVGCRREARELVAARVDIRPESRGDELLGQRHPADGRIFLDDLDAEPCPGEVAGTSKPIVARPDDHCVRHAADPRLGDPSPVRIRASALLAKRFAAAEAG